MGRSTLERLEQLEKEISGSMNIATQGDMLRLVRQALAEPPPRGSADEVANRRKVLIEAHNGCIDHRNFVKTEIEDRMSAAWTGKAAETARTRVAALDHALERAMVVFSEADLALFTFIPEIEHAQRADDSGRRNLEVAERILAEIHSSSLLDQLQDDSLREQAHSAAKSGIATMVRAARSLRDASQVLERKFGELSSRAHAAVLAQHVQLTILNGLVDPLVIADAAVPGGPHDANLILTADAARRANDRLARMNTKDDDLFRGMLLTCDSPQEEAYLLQALAAGYSVQEIQAFDAKIRPHAKDPRWLQQHLTPINETTGPDRFHSQRPVEFGGRAWTQGSDPTCVAMSTVMARAEVDPLYALELTAGGHPGDPAYDNPDAFARRLHDEQHRIYDDGRNWLQDLLGRRADGMTDGQAVDAANEQVAARTGAEYHKVEVDSAGDRRNVLPDVEKAVDQGLPVTFSVQDGNRGHEMAIVGRQGDLLEVYNPWGYTVWVSEDDFVNGRMTVIDNDVPANVHAVNVPRR
ncbi:hypothetical protein ACNTMW_22870 [Planosporangium sp. 12N6]|uniref:hypothetical protein n=1 Tax=Planosporangium spinosum TaxID=3402278 RepID=UPI003CF4E622